MAWLFTTIREVGKVNFWVQIWFCEGFGDTLGSISQTPRSARTLLVRVAFDDGLGSISKFSRSARTGKFGDPSPAISKCLEFLSMSSGGTKVIKFFQKN